MHKCLPCPERTGSYLLSGYPFLPLQLTQFTCTYCGYAANPPAALTSELTMGERADAHWGPVPVQDAPDGLRMSAQKLSKKTMSVVCTSIIIVVFLAIPGEVFCNVV